MPILAFSSLLHENKKKVTASGDRTRAPVITSVCKSNTILSELVRHVLLRISLNVCMMHHLIFGLGGTEDLAIIKRT